MVKQLQEIIEILKSIRDGLSSNQEQGESEKKREKYEYVEVEFNSLFAIVNRREDNPKYIWDWLQNGKDFSLWKRFGNFIKGDVHISRHEYIYVYQKTGERTQIQYGSIQAVLDDFARNNWRVIDVSTSELYGSRSDEYSTNHLNKYYQRRVYLLERVREDRNSDLEEDESEKLGEKTLETKNIEGIPIEELQLSVRAYNRLKRSKINTTGELSQLHREDLLEINGFSMKNLVEVEEALKNRYGIELPSREENSN